MASHQHELRPEQHSRSSLGLRRLLQQIHRVFGAVFALLLVIWFGSGAVMTWVDFPSLSLSERLASAPPLPAGAQLALAPRLVEMLPSLLAGGERVQLAQLEGEPTWLLSDAHVGRVAFRNRAPWEVSELDAARARSELARRTARPVVNVERVSEPDQWTVGMFARAGAPFYRGSFDAGLQRYLSARTGELVQESSARERMLNWFGAIPHWIYPTLLRRERMLWRQVVLVLSALCLVVSLSGTFVGVRLWQRRREKQITRPIADYALRWHHRIGLGFGAFVSTWLFSGALSLSPFHWAGEGELTESAVLFGTPSVPDATALSSALATCQHALDVRELELTSFGGHVYALCYDARAQTRLVDLSVPRAALTTLPATVLQTLAHALSARAELRTEYDAYHYATHREPAPALPYWWLARDDAEQTTLYFDPARLELLHRYTARGRWERWLYHGLHSVDLPALAERHVLWRTLVLTAMALGFVISGLGLLMAVRKILRRQRRARRI